MPPVRRPLRRRAFLDLRRSMWNTAITQRAAMLRKEDDTPAPSEDEAEDNAEDSTFELRNNVEGSDDVAQGEELNDSNIGWAKPLDERWYSMYNRLVKYKQEHGDCLVPQRYVADPQLGHWVMNQRNRKNTISAERKRRLDNLGFVWHLSTLELRVTMYQCLVDFKNQHGHCNVQQRNKDNRKLGRWVSTQRRRKDHLSLEQRNRLEAIGFMWSMRGKTFLEAPESDTESVAPMENRDDSPPRPQPEQPLAETGVTHMERIHQNQVIVKVEDPEVQVLKVAPASNQIGNSAEREVVRTWLLKAFDNRLKPDDLENYTKKLVKDGYDDVYRLNLLDQEDYRFMKPGHAKHLTVSLKNNPTAT